jgi:nucleotide-binding universal stress UspA family protein
MNYSTTQILFPFDFSEQASIAIDQTYRLIQLHKAELTLLYVVDDEIRKDKKTVDEKTHETTMKAKLSEAATALSKKYNITVNTLTTIGRLYDKVIEVADMLNAKMIIMGTKGEDGLKKTFTGFYAMKIVKEAKCPVITMRGKLIRTGFTNIVVPVDLTKESREKVNNAIELAKLYGSTIHIISIAVNPTEENLMSLNGHMRNVKDFIKKSEVKCTGEVINVDKAHETIAEAILNYSVKADADIIIITTQQGIEFMPLFIGSTAQEIINNSDIPVMSIVPTLKQDASFVPY